MNYCDDDDDDDDDDDGGGGGGGDDDDGMFELVRFDSSFNVLTHFFILVKVSNLFQ